MVTDKAIFFDRDGVLIEAPTINRLPKSTKTLSEVKVCRGIEKFCNFYKKKYFLIMITNQPDFSRKKNTKKNINEINNYLKKKLKLDCVFTCFCENNKCKNIKPNPGLIYKGQKKFKLDLSKSYVIGDRWKDIGAGKKASCKTILIDKKYNEYMKFTPTHKVKNLKKIYDIIK